MLRGSGIRGIHRILHAFHPSPAQEVPCSHPPRGIKVGTRQTFTPPIAPCHVHIYVNIVIANLAYLLKLRFFLCFGAISGGDLPVTARLVS